MLQITMALMCSFFMTSCLDKRELDPRKYPTHSNHEDPSLPTPDEPIPSPGTEERIKNNLKSILHNDENLFLRNDDVNDFAWPFSRGPQKNQGGWLDFPYLVSYEIRTEADLKNLPKYFQSGKIDVRTPLTITEPFQFRGALLFVGAPIKFEGGGALILEGREYPEVPKELFCGGLSTAGPMFTSIVITNPIEGNAKFVFKGNDIHLSFVSLPSYFSEKSSVQDRKMVAATLENTRPTNIVFLKDQTASFKISEQEIPHLILSNSSLNLKDINENAIALNENQSRMVFANDPESLVLNSSADSSQICKGYDATLSDFYKLYITSKEVQRNPKRSSAGSHLIAQTKKCCKTFNWDKKLEMWQYCGKLF